MSATGSATGTGLLDAIVADVAAKYLAQPEAPEPPDSELEALLESTCRKRTISEDDL